MEGWMDGVCVCVCESERLKLTPPDNRHRLIRTRYEYSQRLHDPNTSFVRQSREPIMFQCFLCWVSNKKKKERKENAIRT